MLKIVTINFFTQLNDTPKKVVHYVCALLTFNSDEGNFEIYLGNRQYLANNA